MLKDSKEWVGSVRKDFTPLKERIKKFLGGFINIIQQHGGCTCGIAAISVPGMNTNRRTTDEINKISKDEIIGAIQPFNVTESFFWLLSNDFALNIAQAQRKGVFECAWKAFMLALAAVLGVGLLLVFWFITIPLFIGLLWLTKGELWNKIKKSLKPLWEKEKSYFSHIKFLTGSDIKQHQDAAQALYDQSHQAVTKIC